MTETDLRNAVESAAGLLIRNKLTVAFAESATAGRVAAEFSLACEAGKFLRGGLVCYNASLKSDILKVPEEMLKTFTPESMEVTRAIAEGLAQLIDADLHIGITGLPCSGGSETDEKPVGTMFIYSLYRGIEFFSARVVFTGNHKEIIDQTVKHIASLIIEHVDECM